MSTLIKIQEAKDRHIDELLLMLELFYEASGYKGIVDFHKDSLLQTLVSLIDSDDGILLVALDEEKIIGTVGGLIYPFYFNLNHRTAQELFWWVSEESRGKKIGMDMFNAFEDAVKRRGAVSLSMIALDNLTPEVVGGMYVSKGYKASEHSYIRRL